MPSTTTTLRIPNRPTRFGPGSMEGLALTATTRRGIRWAYLTGTYTVFCGAGWSHEVQIAEMDDVQWMARHESCGTVDDVADYLLERALDTYEGCDCGE